MARSAADGRVDQALDRLVEAPHSLRAARTKELQDLSTGSGALGRVSHIGSVVRDSVEGLLWSYGGNAATRAVISCLGGSAVVGGIGETSMAIMAAQRLDRFLQDVQQAFRADVQSVGCLLTAHRALRKRLPSDARQLSETNEQAIVDLDARISALSAFQDKQSIEALVLARQQVCFSIPKGVLDVSHQHIRGVVAQREALDASVRALLGDFSHLDQKILATFFAEVRANCYLPRAKRSQLYLWGPPGTGQTLFARRSAAALGLPFYPMTLTQSDLAAMTGAGAEGGGYDYSGGTKKDPAQVEREMVGPVVVALTEAGVLTPILL